MFGRQNDHQLMLPDAFPGEHPVVFVVYGGATADKAQVDFRASRARSCSAGDMSNRFTAISGRVRLNSTSVAGSRSKLNLDK